MVKLKQAGVLFGEIAHFAALLDRECYHAGTAMVEDRNPETVELQLDRLRAAIQRIGWMADTGAKNLGEMTVRDASAEHWMLSPAFTNLSDS